MSIAKLGIYEFTDEFYNLARHQKHLFQLSPVTFAQHQIAFCYVAKTVEKYQRA